MILVRFRSAAAILKQGVIICLALEIILVKQLIKKLYENKELLVKFIRGQTLNGNIMIIFISIQKIKFIVRVPIVLKRLEIKDAEERMLITMIALLIINILS